MENKFVHKSFLLELHRMVQNSNQNRLWDELMSKEIYIYVYIYLNIMHFCKEFISVDSIKKNTQKV